MADLDCGCTCLTLSIMTPVDSPSCSTLFGCDSYSSAAAPRSALDHTLLDEDARRECSIFGIRDWEISKCRSDFQNMEVDENRCRLLLGEATQHVLKEPWFNHPRPSDSVVGDLVGRVNLYKEIIQSNSLRCIRELCECTVHGFIIINVHC